MLKWLASKLEQKRGALQERLEQVIAAPVPAAQAPLEVDWIQQGNALLDAGDLDGALRSYKAAAESAPENSDAWLNQGFVLLQRGDHGEAGACLERSLALNAGNADAWYLLGGVREQSRQLPLAAEAFRKAIALQPNFAEAHRDLCRVTYQSGQIAQAKATVLEGLAIAPDQADLHFYLGNVLLGEKDLVGAEASFDKALALQPGHVAAILNLARLRAEQGRAADAEHLCAQALRLAPENIEFLLQGGETLRQVGLLPQAAQYFRRALGIDRTHARAHANLAGVLLEQGYFSEAGEHASKAVDSAPQVAAHHNLMGVIWQEQSRLQNASKCFQRALAIDPHYALARTNAGSCHLLSGRLAEAIADYRLALQLEPTSTSANSNLLFAMNYHPDLPANEIFEAYRHFDEAIGRPLSCVWTAHDNPPARGRRLRIGYVSPDFRHHTVMRFLEPVLAHHDKQRFDIYAYAEVVREDAATQRAKALATVWRNTVGQTDEAVAAQIREDRIDVLIDVAGHTAGNRLRVLARKPAPVSASWMGYGYTTGLSAIDHYLTDAVSAPVGSDALFAEKPWRMGRTSYVYRPGTDMGEVGGLPADRNGYVTFGTLTRPIRINARVVRAWAAILQKVPGSRLVVDSKSYGDADTRDHLLAQFAKEGVPPERLQIGYHSPPWGLMRGIDITLDCFPHNSGTTLFESLYMGVPYVTLAGRPSVGRLGASILQGAGHPEWVARSEDEYVAIAVGLAHDRTRLAALRSGLRQEMERSELMDEVGFTRALENSCLAMFGDWEHKVRPPDRAVDV